MTSAARARVWVKWLGWIAILAVATAALFAGRHTLDKAHVTVVYFAVVLGASAHGGRALGFVVSALAFVCFDLLFLLPYGTLALRDPLDMIVLLGFGGAALLAGQLLHRLRAEAANARGHAVEVARLAQEREALLARSRDAERLAIEARARDEVLAALSHDLRTPLTAIRALAHELRETGDERALAIEGEADRLSRLVGNVLDLQRLRAGAMHLDVQPVEVEDLIGVALQQVGASHPAHEIRITLDPRHPLLFVRGDFTQLLRILVNLLDNACRHGGARGAVDLDARRDDEWLTLTIGDRGPGIHDSRRARLFEPWVPGDSAGVTHGTGLGLSIAERLARAQGGTLGFAPREGGGSTFALRLPAVDVTGDDISD